MLSFQIFLRLCKRTILAVHGPLVVETATAPWSKMLFTMFYDMDSGADQLTLHVSVGGGKSFVCSFFPTPVPNQSCLQLNQRRGLLVFFLMNKSSAWRRQLCDHCSIRLTSTVPRICRTGWQQSLNCAAPHV
jgi:hypothetical protein